MINEKKLLIVCKQKSIQQLKFFIGEMYLKQILFH